MLLYLLKRLGMTLLVIILAMAFLASLVHFIPGDPVKTILGPRASDEMSTRIRAEMGLDDPVPIQVYDFITKALRGDFGRDFVSGLPVTTLLLNAIPHTIALAVASLLLAIILGIPIGVYSATQPDTWIDRITGIISVSFVTLPPFVSGLLLLLFFAVFLQVLPAVGTGDFNQPIDYLRHLILPAFAMALTWIGYLARLVRSSVLEVLNANYIRTAYAYGLDQRKINFKYALKNAILPTIAILGISVGNIVGNAVFIEVIFTRPGLGLLIYNSILSRNYPIVRGGIAVAAVLFVLANLIADLSYRILDPRIKLGES